MNTVSRALLSLLLAGTLSSSLPLDTEAATNYVSTTGNDSAAGTNWATAKLTIQAAVDIAAAGNTVLVSNGVYASGGSVVNSMSNRVAITNPITVQSVNGPAVTTIMGALHPGTTNGTAAVRCAYVGGGAVLSGFTLTNGATHQTGNALREQNGGGAWCVTNGTVRNCIVSGNTAQNRGGGIYSGTLDGCVLSRNVAYTNGGGAAGGILNNCLLTGNAAPEGRGCYTGTLYNCTLRNNTALTGGGVSASILYNSIVYSNTASTGGNFYSSTLAYCCTTPDPGGTGNITSTPRFVGPADSHLASRSQCIDAGSNAYVQGATDLDDNPRIIGGTVDMGAYESLAVLTVALGNSGAGVVAGGGDYPPGTNVVISFTPNYPWVFSAWNDGVTNASRIITMPDSNVTYTAYATRPTAMWYVSTNGNDTADGSSWANAKRLIQSAVALTLSNDTVLVSNGIYATGGSVVNGDALSNRVAITNAIIVRSFNGPVATVIQGSWDPLSTNSPIAVRCAYVGENARLSGFTLMGGATSTGGVYRDTCGGGTWCATNAIVSNCFFTVNSAAQDGGGNYGGTLNNCTMSSNVANQGGGACYGVLNNCDLSNNTALEGGGAAFAALNNSLVYHNTATSQGGGGFICWMTHCTIVDNTSHIDAGTTGCDLKGSIIYYNYNSLSGLQDNHDIGSAPISYCCTLPADGGTDIITNAPLFVSASDYHLSPASPCINAGTNIYATGLVDLDGYPRILGGTVDIGAYEYIAGYRAWAAAITNGLTNYNDCATGDGYPNLLKYATGSSPTNGDTLARLGWDWTNGLFWVRFNRNQDSVDVTLVVEGSDALTTNTLWRGVATNVTGSWSGATNVVESGAGTPVMVRVSDMATATNRFFRLRVTQP